MNAHVTNSHDDRLHEDEDRMETHCSNDHLGLPFKIVPSEFNGGQ